MEKDDKRDERAKLKEERKELKRQKRENKRRERLAKVEENNALLQIRPQGNKVSIVTSEFVEQKILRSNRQQNHREVAPINLEYSHFPKLSDNTCKISSNHNKISENSCIALTTPGSIGNDFVNFTKPKSNHPINLQLSDIIVKKEQVSKYVKQKELEKKHVNSSNPLDSSHPEKRVGKHREEPQEKRIRKFKRDVLKDKEINQDNEVMSKFVYSDNVISDELNSAVKIFLKKVVDLQEKQFARNPEKGKRKKRYVVGFHETKKFLVVKKIKILIIAVNMAVVENGTLHEKIKELISIAQSKEIPYGFALSRKSLGMVTLKFIPVSCVGVLNYEGADEFFVKVKEQLNMDKELFLKINESKVVTDEPDVNASLLNNLMEALKL